MSRQPSDPDYAAYISWLHYANGSLQAGLSRQLTLLVVDALSSPVDKRYTAKLAGQLQLFDDRLRDNKYLAGREVSAADAMTVFSLTTMRGFSPVDLSPYENILRYLTDIAARPAYKEAIRKGDHGMEPMIKPVERRFTQFESLRERLERA